MQIYEEDFRRERSDRERLSREKEELQQMNRMSQSRLNQLESKVHGRAKGLGPQCALHDYPLP